ncbi:MAG: GlsB/YeaQ/YmgE family stress response membrane protein [Melioribacteraceae bacterium]|nr:GlsB/YeaQ/YmgE family stress response membrane protein [Melioribacteraceae bacterium]
MNFIIWILSGILAGWLTGKIMKGSGYGILGDLAIGLLGAVVGGFLASVFGLQATSWIGQIVVAVAGGVVLVWVVRKIKGK